MDIPENPEVARVVVRRLLILSPFMFAGSYLLAVVQGAAHWHALVVAVAALAMCLGAALLYWLRGSKATNDMAWLSVILRLVARR